jgi:hypothetical protein
MERASHFGGEPTRYAAGMSSLLAAGSTPISCWKGRNGDPRSKVKDISPTPLRSAFTIDWPWFREDTMEKRTRYARGVMVIVEPTPRGYTTEIVVHNPLQTFHVSEDESTHVRRIAVR